MDRINAGTQATKAAELDIIPKKTQSKRVSFQNLFKKNHTESGVSSRGESKKMLQLSAKQRRAIEEGDGIWGGVLLGSGAALSIAGIVCCCLPCCFCLPCGIPLIACGAKEVHDDW